jgi:hypothetical protein
MQFKPQAEPHFTKYSSQRKWKMVCNDCIQAAHEKRKRKPSGHALDGRDRKHPLEEVIRSWLAISSSGNCPAPCTTDTHCSGEITP